MWPSLTYKKYLPQENLWISAAPHAAIRWGVGSQSVPDLHRLKVWIIQTRSSVVENSTVVCVIFISKLPNLRKDFIPEFLTISASNKIVHFTDIWCVPHGHPGLCVVMYSWVEIPHLWLFSKHPGYYAEMPCSACRLAVLNRDLGT